jgi:TPR repeat protein
LGNRYDRDRPPSAPFVASAVSLSDADSDASMRKIEFAIRACSAAQSLGQGSGNRRFSAQAGRGYAARAQLQAVLGNDDNARSDMNQAVQLWTAGLSQDSSAAMTSLGAYWYGTFNEELKEPRARRGLVPFTFVTPDEQKALRYWLMAADLNNATAMTLAGYLLLGDADRPPTAYKPDVAQAVSWLRKAMNLGNARAMAILGVYTYLGWTKDLLQNQDQGLALLAQACKERDSIAKGFIDSLINRKKDPLNPSRRPEGC